MLKRNWSNNVTPCISIIGISVLTTIVSIALLYLFLNTNVKFSEFPKSNCMPTDNGTFCFFNNNMPAGGMISALSGFYTNLIIIMTAFMTILGILVAFNIQHNAKVKVETELPQLVSSFFKSMDGKSILDEQISFKFQEIKKELESLKTIVHEANEILSGHSSGINEIKDYIDKNDTGAEFVKKNGTEMDKPYE